MKSLAALALALTIGLLAPAAADSTTPTLDYPLARVGDTVDVEVMLEAPLKSWGIRRSAKFYDAQVDGLTIHTRGTCASRPLAVCVRVFVKAYSPEEMLALSRGTQSSWHGINVIAVDETTGLAHQTAPREIHLNAAIGRSPVAARHELGHALGLGHHSAAEGVMGTVPQADWPSTGELDVLRAWYAAPRA